MIKLYSRKIIYLCLIATEKDGVQGQSNIDDTNLLLQYRVYLDHFYLIGNVQKLILGSIFD